MIFNASNVSLINHAGTNTFIADIAIDDDLNIEITNASMQSLTFIEKARIDAEDSGVFTDDCYYKFIHPEGQNEFTGEWILIRGIRPNFSGSISYPATISRLEIRSENIQSEKLELKLNLGSGELIKLMGYLGPRFDTRRFGVIDIRPGENDDNCKVICCPAPDMAYPECRITEILRFCTGSDVNWISGTYGIRRFYQGPSSPLFKEKHLSPFPLDQQSAISLFDVVSEYLIPIQDRLYSPELDSVMNICQAQKNVLNYRLTIGATVEYLIKKFHGNINYPETYLASLDQAKLGVESSQIDLKIKDKLFGALENYRKVAPMQILNLMKARGLIYKKHVNAYNSIRNAGAHGDEINIAEINSFFSKANIVLDLIFRIILNGIKYNGYYYSPEERGNIEFRSVELPLILITQAPPDNASIAANTAVPR